ncbi:MAG: tetraacyldisaccharide 4'-kinase [Magnetococcales bacterium]|nr:tetraacyldisaccharide 4'-kinase [Magnetococcales bacterium]
MKSLVPYLEGRAHPTSLTARLALQTLGGIGHLYGMVMAGRAALYRRHLFTSYRPPCPVISVGNLSAGGTGKTPMVLWLAQQLRRWHRPLAIVSRGYGTPAVQRPGQPRGVTLVADATGQRLAPPEAADEAALLAQNLPGVVVLTGADRARLIRYALAVQGAELILMDDGFQHLPVQRDLDLVLMDARQPLGNGFLLPGGILRESPQALRRCDAILLTRCDSEPLFEQASTLLSRIVPGKPVFRVDHHPVAWRRLGSTTELPLSALAAQPVLAFCGIARPDSFMNSLAQCQVRSTGLRIFPDHGNYSRAIWADLLCQARATQAQAMVCTEKDAVKIDPEWIEPAMPLYVLRMALHFPQEPVWLLRRLAALMEPPR